MKDWVKYAVAFLLFLWINSSESKDNQKAKTSRAHSKTFAKHPAGGLVSFNSDEGKLRIDWAVTIPFISIPLERKIDEHGEFPSLLNVNTKGLGIVGLLATVFTVVSPLLSKTHPQYGYRSEDSGEQWSRMGGTINEMIFGNNYVTPCMQRVVCSVVSVAMHSQHPTSMDKIIDGLASHKWFKDATNGTVIQDAVAMGKENYDCARVYKDCAMTPALLTSVMNELGIV